MCGARQTAGSSRCSSVCLKIEARTQGEDAPCPDELDRLPDFLNADPASVTRTFLHLPPSALSVSGSQPPPAAPGIKLCFPPEPTSERCVPLASAGLIGFFAMLSGPARHRGRPGGVVRCLVSACLLSLLLEARGSYPQSGECKGKGKDCTGKTSTSSTPPAVNQPLCFE